MIDNNEALTTLRGIGPGGARRFAQLNIHTVGELLAHLPRAYEDRRVLTPLAEVAPGEQVMTTATVAGHSWFGAQRRRRTLRIDLGEGDTRAALLCFGRGYLARSCPVGARVLVAGRFEQNGKRLESSSFELETVAASRAEAAGGALGLGTIVPVYALTEGVRVAALRRAMRVACEAVAGRTTPWDAALSRRGLLPVAAALQQLHFPPDWAAVEQARTALAFTELLQLQIALRRRRPPARPLRNYSGKLRRRIIAGLPFALTAGQRAALEEIDRDLGGAHAGARLLQGDVGSGKTLVALLAAAAVIEAGQQAALIVPTELLARQHAETAAALFEPAGINVGLLAGALGRGGRSRSASREALIAAQRRGDVQLSIGTHALIQSDVAFDALGLVIIDEQHRFGVAQRRRLLAKGRHADLLLMTATPIPRSLALTAYGDLELTVIRDRPPGRMPVRTHLARLDRVAKVYARLAGELQRGGRAYVVVPRIARPQPTAAAAPTATAAAARAAKAANWLDAVSVHQKLATEVFPDVPVGLIHGGLDEAEKVATMRSFRDGQLRILVATTVVEVGVDVPEATCMVVLNAERFGLATLHQLRGRVGRGARRSYAFLVYDARLTEAGVARLRAMKTSDDGFVIADRDLEQRGPGELLGLRQAGLPTLRVADLARDMELARAARAEAAGLADGPQTAATSVGAAAEAVDSCG